MNILKENIQSDNREKKEYTQELFKDPELSGYLKKMIESKKSQYNYIVYASDVEMRFKQELKKDDYVIIYTKLQRMD